MSIKVFNTLQLFENAMIQKWLFNYPLLNAHLNRYNSYFNFILMVAPDLNLNPGPVSTIHNSNIDGGLLFYNCNLSIDWTERQFNIDTNNSNNA